LKKSGTICDFAPDKLHSLNRYWYVAIAAASAAFVNIFREPHGGRVE
jgi:hypothetical protein